MICSSCAPPNPGPRVQAILDELAPGLIIGEPVSAQARARYNLTTAPYIGYHDPVYRTAGGLRDLRVHLDEVIDRSYSSVPPTAFIESVSLQIPNDAAMSATLERLRRDLGQPAERCYTVDTAWRWRRLFWKGDGGRGVLVLVSHGPARPLDSLPPFALQGVAPPGAGSITFGVRDIPAPGVVEEKCEGSR